VKICTEVTCSLNNVGTHSAIPTWSHIQMLNVFLFKKNHVHILGFHSLTVMHQAHSQTGNKGICHASTELVQVDIPAQIIQLCGFYILLLFMLLATPPNVILLMFFFGLFPKMLDLASLYVPHCLVLCVRPLCHVWSLLSQEEPLRRGTACKDTDVCTK